MFHGLTLRDGGGEERESEWEREEEEKERERPMPGQSTAKSHHGKMMKQTYNITSIKAH